MCLIISSVTGKEIQKEHLEAGWDSNHHGSGFSYAKDGKLFMEKGFFIFDKFYEAYQKCIGNPHFIHFRWATAGLKDEENCHPFVISENLHFCHNGVLSGWSHKIKEKSDTYAFNEEILKGIANDTKGKDWHRNSGLKWLIESAISSNKFAMIDSTGHIEIFNEDLGEYIDEEKTLWASNSMWKTKKVRNTANSSTAQDYARFMGGYESDYLNRHNQSASGATTLPAKTSSTSTTIEAWNNVSPEELAEIDAYLDELNAVN